MNIVKCAGMESIPAEEYEAIVAHLVSQGYSEEDARKVDFNEKVTVEGVELLRYTVGIDGTVFDHTEKVWLPHQCLGCEKYTRKATLYCAACIAKSGGAYEQR